MNFLEFFWEHADDPEKIFDLYSERYSKDELTEDQKWKYSLRMIKHFKNLQIEIEKCKFKDSLKAEFQCLTQQRASWHAIICISGFLSEGDNMEE